MRFQEQFNQSDSYRFHTMCGKYIAELLASEIIVPVLEPMTDGTMPGSFALDSKRFIELALSRADQMQDKNNRVMERAVAKEVVTGVLDDWQSSGSISNSILEALQEHFSPHDVISESHSHAIIPQTIDSAMNISLTDHIAVQKRIHVIAKNAGMILSEDEVTDISRRKSAAHELGHLIRFLFVISHSRQLLHGYDHQSRSYKRISSDLVTQQNDFLNLDIYNAYPLSQESEFLVADNSMLAAGTSDERIGRGFEFMQLRFDLGRMGMTEFQIDDFMRQFQLYRMETEDDVMHLMYKFKTLGIDIRFLMRSASNLMAILTQHGITHTIARNMLGLDASLLGYSNGLESDQLHHWLVNMESQYLHH